MIHSLDVPKSKITQVWYVEIC